MKHITEIGFDNFKICFYVRSRKGKILLVKDERDQKKDRKEKPLNASSVKVES